MSLATLTSKGQTTIPKKIRNFLKLKTGDTVDFVISENNEVIIRPVVSSLDELKGLLARNEQRPVSVENMNKAVRNREGLRR